MKIRRITATEVVVPAHPGAIDSPATSKPLHKLAQGANAGWSLQFDQLPKLILELELEDGTVGLGECYRAHDWPTVRAFAERLVGLSLHDLPWQQLPLPRRREYDGFECAVLDARAKSLGIRVADLLGGALRDRVSVASWSSHRPPAEMGQVAKRYRELGHEFIKFKCDLEDDVVGWCEAIREAAPGMKVTLDPNERWERRPEALRRIQALAAIGNVLCIEEPIPRWNLDDLRLLREQSPLPIVLHVSMPYREMGQMPQDAVRALRANAVDGFNFNGSASEFQRFAHLASLAGLSCWHGSEVDLGILEARYLHSAAAAESCVWPSDIFGRLIRSHDLLRKTLVIHPPHAILPDGPGLGVELDPSALEHFRTAAKPVVFA